MNRPKVKVTDISNLLGEELNVVKNVNLGGSQINARFNSMLADVREKARKAYLLKWEGNKVPRGAVVGDETLGWTQNGCAHNLLGRIIGAYDRIVEFGGKSKNEQVMIVYRF